MRGAPRIEIRGLRCQAHIGVPASEQMARQEVVVGLGLEYDSRAAAWGDDWPRAVDYQAIADDVVAFVEGMRLKLVEALASRIADRILGDPRVLRVRVEVGKPNALARADTVCAVLEREQTPHRAIVALSATGPDPAETRTRVEALLRSRLDVIAESDPCRDSGTDREGRALRVRTPKVRPELAEELHVLASGFGSAGGHAQVVELDVVSWDGQVAADRSRRWGFLEAALAPLIAAGDAPAGD